MARQVQLRRGTTSEHSSFTGAVGEVTVDTTKDTVVVHDGSTAGGVALAKSSELATYAPLGGATFTGDVNGTNIVLSGYLRGPSTFTIDPAAHGDNTGTLVIAGNLQVDGTQTVVNSTTMTVDDLNITLADGAANAAAADGAGITIDGANATFIYDNTNDEFQINKPLAINGTTAALVFTPSVITANTTAVANTTHYYLNAGTITLTLPASPSAGDVVKITEVAGNTDCVVGRNGSNIMSDASDLTLDQAYAVIYLQYVNATIGWAFA